MFFKIDHIVGHKAGLNKCKKIELAPCIQLDNNGIKKLHKIFKHMETKQYTVEQPVGH
jgi:hypothetical protein